MSQVFPITITAAALDHLRKIHAKQGNPEAFIRLGVKGGGCSGFEYLMKLDTKRLPIDLELHADGLLIVCDAKSAELLQGSTLEYTGNLIGGGFRFDNPNAARSCGCGTSFTPKPRAKAE